MNVFVNTVVLAVGVFFRDVTYVRELHALYIFMILYSASSNF